MARERYLLHAGEETINQPGVEKKADSPKAKWENFWFYHKWHVLIGIVIVMAAAFFIHDFTSNVKPDYQIGLITQKPCSEQAIESLEKELAKYGEDRNSDGKVVVQVDSTVLADDSGSANADPNVQMAGVVRLSADLAEGTSMIFITDDASFRSQQAKQQMFSYLDGAMPPDGASDFDRMRVALKDCKKLAGLGAAVPEGEGTGLLKDLSISLRIFKGTQLEGKKGMSAYFTASKKLFDQVISG